MRRTKLKSKSGRQKNIEECHSILRKILIHKRGSECEICGKAIQGSNLTKFHILPVGKYPKIQFHERNILLACWFPCHKDWHHDFFKAQEIDKKIKKLRGVDYKDRLRLMDMTAPKLSAFAIECWYYALKQELEILEKTPSKGN